MILRRRISVLDSKFWVDAYQLVRHTPDVTIPHVGDQMTSSVSSADNLSSRENYDDKTKAVPSCPEFLQSMVEEVLSAGECAAQHSIAPTTS
jgi:hypothetical protein